MADGLRRLVARQEKDRHYTLFSDCQGAIEGMRDDHAGAGQDLAVEVIEWARQLYDSGNTITIRWVPGYRGVESNDVADAYARSAAEAVAPGSDIGERWLVSRVSMAWLRRERGARAREVWRGEIGKNTKGRKESKKGKEGRGHPFRVSAERGGGGYQGRAERSQEGGGVEILLAS